MGTLALIGLGSNLGDRKALLDGAVAALASTDGVAVREVSRYHETVPVGGPAGQGPFLNAAAAIETTLSPFDLHSALVRVEQEAGRKRVIRWGQRTLDLDLLLFGDEVHDTPSLTVPHPRMPFRRFVLAPLAEIRPDAIDPLTGRSIADLLAMLDRRPSYVALSRPADAAPSDLFPRLRNALHAVGVEVDRPETARCDPRHRSALFSRAAEVMADRLTEATARGLDGWVVSDFWLDGFYHWALPRLEPGDRSLDAFRTRFLWARRCAPLPMLVVVPSRPGPPRPPWADHVASLDPSGHSAAILALESEGEDDALSEVLAACASSRPDGRLGPASALLPTSPPSYDRSDDLKRARGDDG